MWAPPSRSDLDPSTTLELDLVEATALGTASASPTGAARQPFSLVFRGPLTPVALQRIYPLEHATLGAFELFLVPIGPDQQGMQLPGDLYVAGVHSISR